MKPKHEDCINAVLQSQHCIFRAMMAGVASEWLKLDLTMGQVKALVALRHHGAMPVGGLAEELQVGLPAASVLADKLVQLNLVERHEDPNDRRRTLVRLSVEGDRLLQRLREGRVERLRDWLNELSESDLAALTRGFQSLARIATSSEECKGESV